jgi:hypothetical protein
MGGLVNQRQLPQPIEHIPPAEFAQAYYEQLEKTAMAA